MAAQATPQGRPFNGNVFDPNHMDPYYYQNPPVYTQQPVSLVHMPNELRVIVSGNILNQTLQSCNIIYIARRFLM